MCECAKKGLCVCYRVFNSARPIVSGALHEAITFCDPRCVTPQIKTSLSRTESRREQLKIARFYPHQFRAVLDRPHNLIPRARARSPVVNDPIHSFGVRADKSDKTKSHRALNAHTHWTQTLYLFSLSAISLAVSISRMLCGKFISTFTKS